MYLKLVTVKFLNMSMLQKVFSTELIEINKNGLKHYNNGNSFENQRRRINKRVSSFRSCIIIGIGSVDLLRQEPEKDRLTPEVPREVV